MKQINAYIKPHKLNDVAQALEKIKRLRGMSVIKVEGFGRRGENDSYYPGVDDLMNFAQYAKIEIFCDDDLADEIVLLIEKNAYTGLRGDGKIYVSQVDKSFKIGKGQIS
jgi:nitrogen regulatory protein PII